MVEYKMISEEKFNEFYISFSPKLYNYLFYRTRNDLLSEELVQEAFIALFELNINLNNKENEELEKITYRIAKNKMMNWYKNNIRRVNIFRRNISNAIQDGDIYDPEEILEREEISKKVRDILSKLTKAQRDVIILVKLEGYTYKKAAKILKKKEGDVKQLVYRGKEAMKRIIRKEYPEIAARHDRNDRNNKKIMGIIAFILATTMITGIVYASVKVYQYLNRVNTFTLQEVEEERDESKVNIKREKAESLMKEYLSALGIEENNFEELKLTSNGIRNKEIWSIYKEDDYTINISSNTGELVDFILMSNREYIDSDEKISNKEIKAYVEDVVNKLNFEQEYNKLKYKNKNLGDGKILEFYYYNSEDDYHTRRINIRYYKNRITSIINYNYIINNNLNIKVKEKEAIEILKQKYKVKNIENIELTESLVENENTEKKYEERIREDNINPEFIIYNNYTTKPIWEITYNGDMKQCIDCETGEILEDEITYEEKKD